MAKKARNEEILKTAARVFGEKGFHGTRIQDIADELGMRKGSLYHYISSKEELVQGLVAGAMEKMIREMSDIVATKHTAMRKIDMGIEAHLRRSLGDRDVWTLMTRENLDLLNRNSPADIYELMKQYVSLWDQIVAEGVEQGEFDPDLDQRLIVQAVIAMCVGFLRWFDPDGRLPAQEVARQFTEITLRGIQNPTDRTCTTEER